MLYQLAKEATETLAVRGCASNYFHFSGFALPSDLVGEGYLGLEAMISGIGAVHACLSSRLPLYHGHMV